MLSGLLEGRQKIHVANMLILWQTFHVISRLPFNIYDVSF